MPTSSTGGRFVNSIPLPAESDLLGPLLRDVGTYLDSQLDGTYLDYEPVGGSPTDPVRTGRELNVDFAAIYEHVKAELDAGGYFEEWDFSWLAGDWLLYVASKLEIDYDTLVDNLVSDGVIGQAAGREKYRGIHLWPATLIGTSATTSAAFLIVRAPFSGRLSAIVFGVSGYSSITTAVVLPHWRYDSVLDLYPEFQVAQISAFDAYFETGDTIQVNVSATGADPVNYTISGSIVLIVSEDQMS